MRGKKAKALRRQARRLTAGKPERYYGLIRSKKDDRPLRIELIYNCERYVYQRLKPNGG